MGIVKVDPIIIYPPCLQIGIKVQHCLDCELLCDSPRGMCVLAYPNHKKGCPNYGKKKGCPPSAPMFDEVYDISRPVYAIYNVFDFRGHVERMRKKHPKWSKRQLECCLYWQGTARKDLKRTIDIFKNFIPTNFKGYTIAMAPEAMGVLVTETMKRVGFKLEWPPVNIIFQIAFAAMEKK